MVINPYSLARKVPKKKWKLKGRVNYNSRRSKGLDEWLYNNHWLSLGIQLKNNEGIFPYEKERSTICLKLVVTTIKRFALMW